MKAMQLVNGEVVVVDDDDFERFNGFQWRWDVGGYATRHGKRTPGKQGPTLRLHREIMGLKPGDPREVDHKNHSKWDCRKDNLRVCTSQQNDFNRRPRGVSRFKGVAWDKARSLWAARAFIGGKYRHLGRFKCEEEAAKAYNIAVLPSRGEFAYLNKLAVA